MRKLLLISVWTSLVLIGTLNSCTKEKKKTTQDDLNSTLYTEDGNTVTIKDRGKGTGDKTFTADKTWVLDGLVFVNSGQTLTIEPGTVIKGNPGEGVDASALIVARGAKIIAKGTASKPIIFTGNTSQTLTNQRGTWGGVIVLGAARLNTTPSTQQIEGIDTSEPRGEFGGDNDLDNSGIIQYVSIRHGGSNIGADNEINGLTLGGVGSGTTIEYVEVIYNKDDGIEFFGGTVNVKHALVAYCGDDSYDYDMGYRGMGQFWVSIQSDDSDRNGEHDGGTNPETAKPYANPTIFNATYIGSDGGKSKVVTFRDNAAGNYSNSIFANIAKGIDIERLNNEDGSVKESSYNRFMANELKIESNIFSNVAGQSDASKTTKLLKLSVYQGKDSHGDNIKIDMLPTDEQYIKDYFGTRNNEVQTLSITQAAPTTTAKVAVMATYPTTDNFFSPVDYNGAFGDSNWAQGWTLTYK